MDIRARQEHEAWLEGAVERDVERGWLKSVGIRDDVAASYGVAVDYEYSSTAAYMAPLDMPMPFPRLWSGITLSL